MGRPAEDLTGKRFGKLVVQKRVPKPENKPREGTYWECLCDCGQTVIRYGKDLKKGEKKGDIQSCGCAKTKDYTGKRFGRLLVLKRNPEDHIFPSGRTCPMWDCLCDCGNTITTMSWSLENGDTTSCGCYMKEISRKNGKTCKKYNEYDLSGEYGIGYTSKGEEFWFDLEDYDKIKDYCWFYHDNYVVAKVPDEKEIVRLHRLIMDAKEDDYVDHIKHPKINENKVNNRKSNLRITTNSQNCMNRHVSSNNKSGVTGVHWSKSHNAWQAYIGFQNKQIYLGFFDNKEDAIKVRKEAEEKYFKEYSFDNSLKLYDDIMKGEEYDEQTFGNDVPA